MEVGKTLRITTREAWRAWLQKNHASRKEVWLVSGFLIPNSTFCEKMRAEFLNNNPGTTVYVAL